MIIFFISIITIFVLTSFPLFLFFSIRKGFKKFSFHRNTSQMVDKNEIKINSSKIFEIENHNFFEPVMQEISFERMKKDNFELMDKYNKIKNNDPELRKTKKMLILTGILIFALIFIISIFIFSIHLTILGLIFSFLPYFSYKFSFLLYQKDIVKFLVAENNNWLYSPNYDQQKLHQLNLNLKNYFKKGNRGQNYVEDQMWGSVDNTYFNLGLYIYKITRSHGKSSSTTTYINSFIAIKLDKKINFEFILKPKFDSNWFKKDIETESIEFNKAFSIDYYDKDNSQNELLATKQLDVKSLNELIDLKKFFGEYTIFFKKDYILFQYPKPLLKNYKTNLFKDNKIKEIDVKNITYNINRFIELTQNLIKSTK